MGKTDKEQKKRSKRTELDTYPEHERETKRLRTYSDDFVNIETGKERSASVEKRLRTRAIDEAEEAAVNEKDDLTPEEWRKEHNITIRGHGSEKNTHVPDPFRRFKDAPFNDRIQQSFTNAGFEEPTAIQAQAWPIALTEKDMINIAKTGSGKTCGVLLPAFHQNTQKNERRQGYVQPVILSWLQLGNWAYK